jgi:flagellar biosynthesis protein FlhF
MPAAVEKLQHGEIKPVLASLFSHMGVANASLGLDHIPSVVALIGTTGVGKTSMIAKLAAHHTLEHHKNVALLTIDDYRIGAIEQLNAYAGIIGLPLERASTPAELKARLREFKKYDLILIDTPGLSKNNTRQIEEIASCLKKIHHIQILLVLSASTKQKDLLDTIWQLGPIGPQQLIFTKLDESITYGNLLNILLRSNLPMSYFSRGQRVSEDIEAATIETLVDLILSKSMEFDRRQSNNEPGNLKTADHPIRGAINSDHDSFFVANKNSDVYHVAGCKWTNKIKQNNIITFESAAAAEQKNYLPCRNCNPDRSEHNDMQSFARDKKNMALY